MEWWKVDAFHTTDLSFTKGIGSVYYVKIDTKGPYLQVLKDEKLRHSSYTSLK